MQQQTTWILVSDASRARVFEQKPKGGYSLLETLEHPDSRAHVRDLMADANGRKPVGPSVGHVFGRRAAGVGRPGVAPDTDPKEVEAQKFAHQLAEMLTKGLDAHAYGALILAAPPHFLGLLRATISEQVAKHVAASIGKDFTAIEGRDLEARVEALRGGEGGPGR